MQSSIWIHERGVPLDFNGPVDRPFTPFAPEDLEKSPVARFDRMAATYPDRLAVDDGHVQLSYAQLRRAAQALARRLADETPAERPIAAVLHYTALFPAVLLASIATGRPIVPVDAAYPLARQQMILANAGADTLLVAAGVALEAELPALPRIEASLEALLAEDIAAWPDIAYDPDRMAGVTFTSGSTGNPKGLVWSFGGFLPSVAEMTATHHINAEDKIIALGSLASAGLGDAMFALLNGATLRVVDVMKAGLPELLRILHDDRITILSFVPAILRSVLAMPGAERAFKYLRILDLYGDATLLADVRFFREKLPAECCIRVVLGSIEAGAIFHWFVPHDFDGEALALPCGYIGQGKQVAVLDPEGRPVPPGAEGELVVRSRAMAMGAWQAGRLTQGPFLPDPDDAKGRIYYMGDNIRLRADGLCEFVGRRDRMVKVRGLRADLGEIEAAIRSHPAIEDVAVVAVIDEEDTQLVAYCVSREGESAAIRAGLRRAISEATADHMIPRRFHFLDRIPRLPNYKPDLVRLADMARATNVAVVD